MTSQFSERFHDNARREDYLDLIQSSLDRPAGCEQAWFIDRAASPAELAATPRRTLPRLSFRWFTMPRLPVPFLTWA